MVLDDPIGFDSVPRVCYTLCIIYHGTGRFSQQIQRLLALGVLLLLLLLFFVLFKIVFALLLFFFILLCLGLSYG